MIFRVNLGCMENLEPISEPTSEPRWAPDWQIIWVICLFYGLSSSIKTYSAIPYTGLSPFALAIPFSSVQLLSHVWLFATPWTAAHQASLHMTNSQSLLKLMSIKSVILSNHLILCHPLLLQPSIFPSIRVFSNESVLHIRWPKYWSFSFNISPSNEYSGLILRMDWLDFPAVQGIYPLDLPLTFTFNFSFIILWITLFMSFLAPPIERHCLL